MSHNGPISTRRVIYDNLLNNRFPIKISYPDCEPSTETTETTTTTTTTTPTIPPEPIVWRLISCADSNIYSVSDTTQSLIIGQTYYIVTLETFGCYTVDGIDDGSSTSIGDFVTSTEYDDCSQC